MGDRPFNQERIEAPIQFHRVLPEVDQPSLRVQFERGLGIPVEDVDSDQRLVAPDLPHEDRGLSVPLAPRRHHEVALEPRCVPCSREDGTPIQPVPPEGDPLPPVADVTVLNDQNRTAEPGGPDAPGPVEPPGHRKVATNVESVHEHFDFHGIPSKPVLHCLQTLVYEW